MNQLGHLTQEQSKHFSRLLSAPSTQCHRYHLLFFSRVSNCRHRGTNLFSLSLSRTSYRRRICTNDQVSLNLACCNFDNISKGILCVQCTVCPAAQCSVAVERLTGCGCLDAQERKSKLRKKTQTFCTQSHLHNVYQYLMYCLKYNIC